MSPYSVLKFLWRRDANDGSGGSSLNSIGFRLSASMMMGMVIVDGDVYEQHQSMTWDMGRSQRSFRVVY